jgi:hypothetical protein
MKLFLLLGLVVAFCSPISAQTSGAAQNQDSTFRSQMMYPQRYAIGLVLPGTQAFIGVDIAAKVAPKFDVRLGYNFLSFDLALTNYAIQSGSDNRYNINTKFDMSALTLLGGYAPGKKERFRLTAGLGYFPQNRINGDFEVAQEVRFNDVTISPDEVGQAIWSYTYASKISPYVGITFGRVIARKSRLSFSCDLGSFYKGKPDIEIDATGLLTENYRNEEVLERNLKSATWWPVASMRLGFRITK